MAENFTATFRKLFFVTFVVFVCSLIAAFFWFTKAENSALKNLILENFPIPIVSVQGQKLSSRDYFYRLKSARALYGKSKAETELKNLVLERMIYEKKLESLAREKNANFLAWQDFSEFRREDLEKNLALRLADEQKNKEARLRFWYFGQRDLNPEAYKTADRVLVELADRKNFADLYRQFDWNPSALSLEGDLGPVLAENLLYELKEPLLSAKQGDTLVLPSRLGVHIINLYFKKISENGEDMLYLKQIFLGGRDFESWVREETKNYEITNLIKIN